MAYAATADITARVAAVFTLDGSSKPTTTEVTAFINERAGEIDAVLSSRGLTTPVTTPSSFVDYLTGLNADGAAADTLEAHLANDDDPELVDAVAYWTDRYRRALDAFGKGEMIPSSAPKSGPTVPETYFTRNPDEEEDLGDLHEDYTINRGRVF